MRQGGEFVDSVVEGSECEVLLDKTNFYAEAGGQAPDVGQLMSDKVKYFITLVVFRSKVYHHRSV